MTIEIPSWFFNNLDWAGFTILAYGIYSFAKFRTEGFFWACIGSIVILAWSIYYHHWGAAFWNAIFALLYYDAYKKKLKVQEALTNLMKKD